LIRPTNPSFTSRNNSLPTFFSGDIILVSVRKTGFHLTLDQIRNWLQLFGSLESPLCYLTHPRKPHMKQDSLEVLMRLRKHIFSTLPAYGRKLFVNYRGQPIQCSGCLSQGHLRKECKSERSNWGKYIRELHATKRIPDPYFGTWSSYFAEQPEGEDENEDENMNASTESV